MDSVKYWRRLRRVTHSVLALLITASLPAVAAWPQTDADAGAGTSARELLEHFVAGVDDFSADFEQNRYDADGGILETSSGTFSLLRPDRFRWDYDKPYEYRVIADGEYLWEYDVDLEQATRSPLSDLATTPAMLLSGKGTVGDSYDVRDAPVEAPAEPDERWIALAPKGNDGDFDSIKIAFRHELPHVLELVDGLGETTRITFEDIRVNTGLKAKVFEFDPPRGVNVVGVDD